jgi:predicted nucleic acid-binding protein
MTTYYLDTNIFLYAADPRSPYHEACKGILVGIAKGSLKAFTSVETIQEIVYFHQRQRQIRQGLKLVDDIFKLMPELLPVDKEIIIKFRKLLDRYPGVPSRDLVHLATCEVNGLRDIISIDRDFDKFKEVSRILPEELAFH